MLSPYRSGPSLPVNTLLQEGYWFTPEEPAAIALAKLVIHLAKEGERDPSRLCERAVTLMSK